MFTALVLYGVSWFVTGHMLFGAGEALNHGAWHWVAPRELPRFMREGRAVHMLHHKTPAAMEHIRIPLWGHIAIIKGILAISFALTGVVGALPALFITGLSWGWMFATYATVSMMSACGMASYMWWYGFIHRNTHTRWTPNHLLYGHRHIWHHEHGHWNDPRGMAILPIYGWAMGLKPIVVWGIRMWKRWEDAQTNST